MGTRCMHYGQIEWGQDAFSRTNPSQKLICMGTQYTNTHRGSMYWDTRCIYGDMMYAQRESMFLMEILMNPCKWRHDAYSEDHAIEWTNPMGRAGYGVMQSHVDKLYIHVCSST